MKKYRFFKIYISKFLILSLLFIIAGCSINPATGDRQFTALMSPAQENKIGAEEHPKIMAQFGGAFPNRELEKYVNEVGHKVAKNTERTDVDYKFFIIDSPMVNAFAVPGGYIYVSRGLLALANNEAELAAVLAHEVAHITARHSAQRYSSSVLTTLGATILAAKLDTPEATRAINLGTNLYMKSYSRTQEHQADELGLRYLAQAGYEPFAMAEFLKNLDRYTKLQNKIEGRTNSSSFNYFSTHPTTSDRVSKASTLATSYANYGHEINQIRYFKHIKNLEYGDSSRQGFVRHNNFYHPDMGFTYKIPEKYKTYNNSENITSIGKNGEIVVLDMVKDKNYSDPYTYMISGWMKGESLEKAERIEINSFKAATASFKGKVKGKQSVIRLIVIEWGHNEFFRFQIAIPYGISNDNLTKLKEMTYSFRKMTDKEKRTIKPYHIEIRAAGKNDNINRYISLMAVDNFKEETFRVINGMEKTDKVIEGRIYKIITD